MVISINKSSLQDSTIYLDIIGIKNVSIFTHDLYDFLVSLNVDVTKVIKCSVHSTKPEKLINELIEYGYKLNETIKVTKNSTCLEFIHNGCNIMLFIEDNFYKNSHVLRKDYF